MHITCYTSYYQQQHIEYKLLPAGSKSSFPVEILSESSTSSSSVYRWRFAFGRHRVHLHYKHYLHHSVEEIHSVGTINNVETSYFTQLKICYLMTTFRCPLDVLITSWLFTAQWSTWPGNQEVRSEDQGTQERSGVFHAGTWTRASRARESSVTHKSAITDHAVEENHVIDWDKAKVVDREAQRQTLWIKEALWIRKTPMCMNLDAGSYQLSHTWDQVISRSHAPSSCKQSRRDQDVRRISKRCH